MHLEITGRRADGFNEITTVHGEERLEWTVTTYGRVNVPNSDTVVGDINRYWADQPEETQAAIFACYQEVKDELDLLTDPLNMARRLQSIIARMYEHMPFARMRDWLYMRGGLHVPHDIRSEYDRNTNPRKETTYLREHYIDLLGLALAVRPLIPIWGEYLTQIGQTSDAGMFKEFDAVGLAKDTGFIHSEPAQKLQDYIEAIAQKVFKNGLNLNALLSGMGSEEVPVWLFSSVLVRRLTIVPLSDPGVTHSVIANIHKYIDNRLKPNDRRQGSEVKEKTPDTQGARDEDDKTSLMENYKIKQSVADGDVVLYEHFSEDIVHICQMQDPTFDFNLTDHFPVDIVDQLMEYAIADHQVHLAQWALAPTVSPRAFRHVNKITVVRFMVAATMLYWHWGFQEMAVFVLVRPTRSTNNIAPGINPNPRPNTRINQQQREKLDALYPHRRLQRGRNNANQGNVAVQEVQTLTREMNSQTWHYVGPAGLKRLTEQPKGRQTLVTAANLKNQIIDLVIFLAERQKNT